MIRESVTVRTEQGIFTVFCADRGVGKPLYYYREYELDLTTRTGEFIRNLENAPPKGEGTILDIGANIGVTSVSMIRKGFVKNAVAVEPDPRNFSLLEHNIRQNGLDGRVVCLPYAVSDKRGTVKFELSNKNFGDHRVRPDACPDNCADLCEEPSRSVIEVDSDCIDHLIEDLPASFTDEIALIWVDVQGYEGYVFLGGKNTLSRDVPVVAELWPYGIRRTGMNQEQFCNIATGIWSSYWVLRQERFVQYPISELSTLFDELGYDGAFTNVIFTQSR